MKIDTAAVNDERLAREALSRLAYEQEQRELAALEERDRQRAESLSGEMRQYQQADAHKVERLRSEVLPLCMQRRAAADIAEKAIAEVNRLNRAINDKVSEIDLAPWSGMTAWSARERRKALLAAAGLAPRIDIIGLTLTTDPDRRAGQMALSALVRGMIGPRGLSTSRETVFLDTDEVV